MKLKRICTVFFSAVLALSCARTAAASLTPSAASAVLIDASTGRVLYEKNADERRSMASTTKIMTAIVAIEQGNLDDIVTVSDNAAGTEGSSIWLEAGEKLSLRDLLYGLMLNSGNDAAVAIAEHIGGSVEGFAALMNETAKRIGANNSQFKNPNGLDAEGHYTTAKDLGKIAVYALKNPTFAEIVRTKKTTIPWEGHKWDRTLENHNKLLSMYEGADGVKTGYTKSTGRSLVSSATRDGWQVVAVTLNCPDDWNEHMRMFDYAFSQYTDTPVLTAGERMGTFPVENGLSEKIAYTTIEGYSVRCRADEDRWVSVDFVPARTLTAPIARGDIIGTAVVRNGTDVLCEKNLLALTSVDAIPPEKGWSDYLKILVTALIDIMR